MTEKKRKIMLVDDDADFIWLTARMLEDAGYQVIEARNGEEGLRRFHKETSRSGSHGLPPSGGKWPEDKSSHNDASLSRNSHRHYFGICGDQGRGRCLEGRGLRLCYQAPESG